MAGAATDGKPVEGEPSHELSGEVRAVLRSLFPGGTVLDVPSGISRESVALTAYDEAEGRTTVEIIGDLARQLRGCGWAVADGSADARNTGLYAARRDVGGGVFGVEAPAVTFHGIPVRGQNRGDRPTPPFERTDTSTR
ncbi:hypothetical protein OG422_18735 [Streptomyces sp. NBC_01525]|uniref:hypothetical protein n=1 Tax=Streptomyces sp. NBC_01525 TaxID=2903893 RepID=UPI00386C2125